VEAQRRTPLDAWLAARAPALRRHTAHVLLQRERRRRRCASSSCFEGGADARTPDDERFSRQCAASWLRECSQVLLDPLPVLF